MSLKFTILYGSYLNNRTGIRIVKYIDSELIKLGHLTQVIDAKELQLSIIEKRYIDYESDQVPPVLENLKDIYENETDAFVIIAGEYNGTIQPGLKNLLDFFYKEYFHRPSGIITYSAGALGGARISADLRALMGVLGMPAIPTILSFPEINKQLDESGHLLNPTITQSTQNFLNELGSYAHALKNISRFLV